MAIKSSNVAARVEPEIKAEAEAILAQLAVEFKSAEELLVGFNAQNGQISLAVFRDEHRFSVLMAYFQNQAMDMPNYDESRFIYLGAGEGKYIVLPRGLLEEILKRFDKAGIRYDTEDKKI